MLPKTNACCPKQGQERRHLLHFCGGHEQVHQAKHFLCCEQRLLKHLKCLWILCLLPVEFSDVVLCLGRIQVLRVGGPPRPSTK